MIIFIQYHATKKLLLAVWTRCARTLWLHRSFETVVTLSAFLSSSKMIGTYLVKLSTFATWWSGICFSALRHAQTTSNIRLSRKRLLYSLIFHKRYAVLPIKLFVSSMDFAASYIFCCQSTHNTHLLFFEASVFHM